MAKMKGDNLMSTWHDLPRNTEYGFDGNNFIIKMPLEKPVHNDWNCIEENGEITCPKEIMEICFKQVNKKLAPCIVGFVDMKISAKSKRKGDQK